MYESCGLYGKSSIRIVDLTTGKVKQKLNLPRDIFAEGLTISKNVIYLLTWKNKRLFMYDKRDLTYLGVRRYKTYSGEGWGLTTDGSSLIVSDGSDRLTYYNIPIPVEGDALDVKGNDAEYMVQTNQIRVFDPIAGRTITQINELEYHQGNIYANIWYKDAILRINATSGRINERYDASKLYPKATRSPEADCLNGIAYDANDDAMILTGKNWPKYYKINFTEMDIRRSMEL